jgi:hypothetical protein
MQASISLILVSTAALINCVSLIILSTNMYKIIKCNKHIYILIRSGISSVKRILFSKKEEKWPQWTVLLLRTLMDSGVRRILNECRSKYIQPVVLPKGECAVCPMRIGISSFFTSNELGNKYQIQNGIVIQTRNKTDGSNWSLSWRELIRRPRWLFLTHHLL